MVSMQMPVSGSVRLGSDARLTESLGALDQVVGGNVIMGQAFAQRCQASLGQMEASP